MQNIDLGNTGNDGNGDTLREGGAKINANFNELSSSIAASASGVLQFETLADAVVYYDGSSPSDYTRFDVRDDDPNNGEYIFLSTEADNYRFENPFANTNNIVTLADPTNLAELNAITGMVEGDLAVVTNYLNDKVTFIYDGTSWIRAKAQEFSAVVRYNETSEEFEFIDDSAHTPLGTLGITTNPTTNFQFSIQYPTSTTIGAVVAGVDEEFARRGMFIGASVGNGESFFKVVKQGFNVRLGGTGGGVIVANETSTLLKADSFTITHDAGTGETTISHPTIPCQIDSRALAYDTGNVLRPFVKSFTPTGAVLTWWKRSDNTQQLALATTMKAVYQQLGTYQMPNNVISDSGNFWIKGTFYTA